MKGRLPTESEWEYLAIQGDKQKDKNTINCDFKHNWITPNGYYSITNENNTIVEDLFGNCWEWCSNVMYPYDGFCIDPVYREYSYPHFGSKKIVRGGAWCVPYDLCNSKYRNAQIPETQYQYIGFRVVQI